MVILDFRVPSFDLQATVDTRPAYNRKSEIANLIVPVAQPDRASDFGSEGWGFESLQARVVDWRAS